MPVTLNLLRLFHNFRWVEKGGVVNGIHIIMLKHIQANGAQACMQFHCKFKLFQ